LYREAYSFIRVDPEERHDTKTNPQDLSQRLAKLEVKLARQTILEAKLVVLEEKMERLKQFH
jgi:hypothetical protein